MKERHLWTREEMILALNLYIKIPFGKISYRNKDIIALAKIIGRTPSSVAYRLVNYASCDPVLLSRGVSGMKGGHKKCMPYWDEFNSDREKFVYESEQILAKFRGTDIETQYKDLILDIPSNLVGKTRTEEIKIRVNQNVFREIVLSNYDCKCALSGIDLQELLVASHIIPWAKNKEERLNPANGICFSSLYDKAFDQGLISFTDNCMVLFSDRLKSNVGKKYYSEYFKTIEGRTLNKPVKYSLNPKFLEWHRDFVFNKK